MTEHANIELTRFLDSDEACVTEDARRIATRAFTAGYDAGFGKGVEFGSKDEFGRPKLTLDRARDLAETYDGGEGNHPLARHRDSMG